ncbi:unnamed protein product [Closterium sp. Naga37s-1]|nr:unnamed protein product [Closterium sp. Naga37s-1]
MRAYWMPSATPDAPKKVDPPPTDTTCPEGCGKLRLKDLFPIVFTPLPPPDQPLGFGGGSGRAVEGGGAAGSGKGGERRGLVELACGGTGYAGHGDGLVAKAFKPLGSGPAAAPPIKPTRLL